jgi:hypothetical protein
MRNIFSHRDKHMMYVSIFDIIGIIAALLTLGLGVFLIIIKIINRCNKKNCEKKD